MFAKLLRSSAFRAGVLCSVCAMAAGVEVGVARCDITPDVRQFKVPLAGYGARMGRPATGVHDPLHAKVLFFREGATAMALVTADLRSITPEFKTQIVDKAAGLGFTPDNVLVCASHTHAGPAMYPEKFWQFQFGTYDPAIVEVMSSNVARAIEEAVGNAAPAKVGYGEGAVEGFTRNRRWGYDTAAREAAGESPDIDPTLRILRVDALDGTPRALLVNFATHPTIAGAKNFTISAEWPGVLQAEIEKAFPGAVALFTNGAFADQSPAGAKGADDFEKIADFGTRLAQEAARLAKSVVTTAEARIACRRAEPPLPPLAFSEAATAGRYAHLLEQAREALPKAAELQVFAVGDTAMVGLPGEPICAVGQATRAAVAPHGFRNVLILGVANDYLGYILNAAEYAHGGYEVDQRSYYGPGLGDFIAQEAGKVAGQLGLGR